MPTPKSLRAAPSRVFENYILTLSVDNNMDLVKVPQENFSQVPGPPGVGGNDDNTSDPLQIGFPFEFDGITYHQYMVSTNGWVILIDPQTPPGTPNGTIVSDVMVNTYSNARINSLFSRNHVLFAVWYDDLRNTYSSPNELGLSALQIDLYEKGLNQPDIRVNPRKYGVQYYFEKNSNEGRRLIIRWSCVSDYSVPNSVLRFEFVLYENGKIEYRYAKRDTIGSTTANEDATIGVFMPGSAWRFRDFSYELGYGSNRSRYSLGGAVSGSYTDTADTYTVPYGVGLKPNTYWPGQKNIGAIFTFQPPLNRKKVLPRLEIRQRDSRLRLPTVARTGDSRTGAANVFFDDRKSIAYRSSSVVVDYPSVLPRFYSPSIHNVTLNQSLFSGDLEVTRSISKSAIQDYLDVDIPSYVRPFNDHNRPENDPGSDSDSFFLTGSSTVDVGEGFSQPLKSKTQIKLSFRVDHKTKMFEASSSIYYFNPKVGRWQYPTSSLTGGQLDIADPYGDASNYRIIEVDRGFNAFGFNVASGSSNNRNPNYPGTDPLIGSNLTKENEIKSIANSYSKSVQVDRRFSATSDETITIPIQQPFLLEKAVFDLPIEAGPGWFNDKTRCFIPLTDESPYAPDELNAAFDIGGPGLTLALYNQISTGPNANRRDLILSGTITHQFDDTAEIVFSNTPDISASDSQWIDNGGQVWQVTPQGFRAYGTPTAVVKPSSVSGSYFYFYTGSVKLNCAAEISNGVLARDTICINQAYDFGSGGDSDSAKSALNLLFSSSQWKNERPYTAFGGGNGFRERKIVSVNNFGRGCAGFVPSGRSILGKEYVTSQGSTDFYDNPFYLYQGATTLTDIKNAIGSYDDARGVVIASSVMNKSKSFTSPYLLLPGDKLVLAISKARPVFFSTLTSSPWTSGSIQHDIKLTTGSINITLYGSLVANGSEFHDTLNQPLASDAIHEVVVGGTNT